MSEFSGGPTELPPLSSFLTFVYFFKSMSSRVKDFAHNFSQSFLINADSTAGTPLPWPPFSKFSRSTWIEEPISKPKGYKSRFE